MELDLDEGDLGGTWEELSTNVAPSSKCCFSMVMLVFGM